MHRQSSDGLRHVGLQDINPYPTQVHNFDRGIDNDDAGALNEGHSPASSQNLVLACSYHFDLDRSFHSACPMTSAQV